MERMIQKESAKYLSLSILLFQAEHFLRKEALDQGIDIENLRRSDFVNTWALEWCICEIVLYLLSSLGGLFRLPVEGTQARIHPIRQ